VSSKFVKTFEYQSIGNFLCSQSLKLGVKFIEKGDFTPSAILAIKIVKTLNKKNSEIFLLYE